MAGDHGFFLGILTIPAYAITLPPPHFGTHNLYANFSFFQALSFMFRLTISICADFNKCTPDFRISDVQRELDL